MLKRKKIIGKSHMAIRSIRSYRLSSRSLRLSAKACCFWDKLLTDAHNSSLAQLESGRLSLLPPPPEALSDSLAKPLPTPTSWVVTDWPWRRLWPWCRTLVPTLHITGWEGELWTGWWRWEGWDWDWECWRRGVVGEKVYCWAVTPRLARSCCWGESLLRKGMD